MDSYLETPWENVQDVIIVIIMIILLLIILIGFSIYLLFMRKDEANKDRLLNVLYAYLSVCYQLSSLMHFVHYLTLSSGHTDTVVFCLLGRCRIFVASFILQMYLQISVVTSISHYNPSLYLDISLHWRRLPTLCLQFLAAAVILGGIEHLTTGFGDICIGEAVLYKIIWLAFPLKAMNLLLQLGVVVDSFWGWSRIRKLVTSLMIWRTNSVQPQPETADQPGQHLEVEISPMHICAIPDKVISCLVN